MTRKHLKRLATELGCALSIEGVSEAGARAVARGIIGPLADTNPRFQSQRFVDAVLESYAWAENKRKWYGPVARSA